MTSTPNRSDIVRARRSQRTSKPSSTKRRSASQKTSKMSRTMPPMVRRGPMAQTPQAGRRKKKKKAARRRVSVPLRSTPGAEMRLPAIPQVKFGWRVASALLTLALSWTLYTVWNAPQFTVTQAEVIGLERVSSHEINTILKVAGTSIFTVDPAALQDLLQKNFQELTGVTVSVSYPNIVTVEVTERYPVVLWVQSGVETWVDQEGIGILARGAHPDWLVPVQALSPANEEEDSFLVPPALVAAILDIAPAVPAGQTLFYDGAHGLGWEDPSGWKVYFGENPTDMETRLAIYSAIVDYLKERGIVPEFISVEHIHAPYYRLTAQD